MLRKCGLPVAPPSKGPKVLFLQNKFSSCLWWEIKKPRGPKGTLKDNPIEGEIRRCRVSSTRLTPSHQHYGRASNTVGAIGAIGALLNIVNQPRTLLGFERSTSPFRALLYPCLCSSVLRPSEAVGRVFAAGHREGQIVPARRRVPRFPT